MKKIVTIGGGSGQYVLLSALRDLPDADIRAIVSMADSGGSTGRLRDELGVLPPGDILKCLVALSNKREVYRELLLKRFNTNGKLNGHSVGNFLLTFTTQYVNCFTKGIRALGEILETQGQVLPVTTCDVTLVAELINGDMLRGETRIDITRGRGRKAIKEVKLIANKNNRIKVHEPAKQAVKTADYIIIGPGDLYTSIIPNLIVPGMKAAIKNTKAKVVYILNIMTKYGETDSYSGADFVNKVESHIGRPVDIVIANNRKPSSKLLGNYQKEKADFVVAGGLNDTGKRKIVKTDLLNTAGDLARHDTAKLTRIIKALII